MTAYGIGFLFPIYTPEYVIASAHALWVASAAKTPKYIKTYEQACTWAVKNGYTWDAYGRGWVELTMPDADRSEYDMDRLDTQLAELGDIADGLVIEYVDHWGFYLCGEPRFFGDDGRDFMGKDYGDASVWLALTLGGGR